MDEIKFNYLIYGVKLKYSEYFNNIVDENKSVFSNGFDLIDNQIYVIIDDLEGKYVYVGNIISKTDELDNRYKNSNPLTKVQIEKYLDKMFVDFLARPILYQNIKHYY